MDKNCRAKTADGSHIENKDKQKKSDKVSSHSKSKDVSDKNTSRNHQQRVADNPGSNRQPNPPSSSKSQPNVQSAIAVAGTSSKGQCTESDVGSKSHRSSERGHSRSRSRTRDEGATSSKSNRQNSRDRSSPGNRRSRSKDRRSKSSRHSSKRKSVSACHSRRKHRRSVHDMSSDSEEDNCTNRKTLNLNSEDVGALVRRIEELERQNARGVKSKKRHDDGPHFSFDERDFFADDGPLNSSFIDPDDEQNESGNDLPPEVSNKEPDDILSILNEGSEGRQKGPPLGCDSMNIVSGFFDKEPDSKVIKTIKDRYLIPENCENLSGKEVNVEIYRGLNSHIRKKDFCLKGIQNAVSTAAIANLRLIDDVSRLYKEHNINHAARNKLLQLSCDAAKVLAKGYADISVFRKFVMRPHIQQKYQQLCTKRTYGPSLFGTDLAKEVKTIDEESKIMRHLGRPQHSQSFNSQHRYHPYQSDARFSKNGAQRGRGAFRPQYRHYQQRRMMRGRGRSAPAQNQSASQQ